MFCMQTITPFLWFNDNAEEAMDFYMSVFPNSKIITRMPGANGKASGVAFEINGQRLMLLNGGPAQKLTESFSLFVTVETQEEVDELWEKLSEGGQKSVCGWLKDKFGLSWQIIPSILGKLLSDPDREKANRAMHAMLGMTKLDIIGLQKAFDGE